MSSCLKKLFLSVLATGLVAVAGYAQSTTPLASLPLYFEANRGQADGSVQFIARGRDSQFLISPTVARIVLRKADVEPATVQMRFAGANPQARVRGAAEMPGKINYGSSGVGTTQELGMEWLQQLGDFKLTEIPYRGAGQAAPDLLSGRTQLMLTGTAGSLPYLRSGQLKALAIVSPRRIDALPDVPTMAEQGFPSFEAPAYVGLYAPAGTPKDVVARMQELTARAMRAPDVRERLVSAGLNPLGSTPEALATRIDNDSAKWAQVLRGMRAR